MRFILVAVFASAFSIGALADEAIDLRLKGVQAASSGDFGLAQTYLGQSAKLGYYTAQVEYAYLLESSPGSVQDSIESYAWYSVVIARKGTDREFAKEGLARLEKVMPAADLKEAKIVAAKYIEIYAK